jgi:hypothetical protein
MADKPRQYVLVAEPIRVSLSPFAFHAWSGQYRIGAKAVATGEAFSPVPYYLNGLAAELGVKAFLLAKGVPRKTLAKKKLGHNLDALFALAKEHGLAEYLTITDEQQVHLGLLNEYYSSRSLEYFPLDKALRGFVGLPSVTVVGELVDALLTATKTLCREAA